MSTKVQPNRKQRRAGKAKARKSSPNGSSPTFQKYISSRGTAVRFYPMPPMLMEKIEVGVEATFGPRPTPPTYTIETAVGEKETHTHTKDTLETKADKAAWKAYEDELEIWENELNRRVLRAIQLECIKPESDDEEWAEKQAFLGIPVPENKFERHLHWVETEFIGSQDDVLACMTVPMRLAGAEEEDLAAAEKLFRGAVSEKTNSESAAA